VEADRVFRGLSLPLRPNTAHIAFALAALGMAVVYLLPPEEFRFYPGCPIHLLTGWLCPGCGATRALHALLHGHMVDAWALNPLFTVVFPVAALWFMYSYAKLLLFRGTFIIPVSRRVIPLGLAVTGSYFLLRNL